jgi:uncharacterized protein (TIGR02145 family)
MRRLIGLLLIVILMSFIQSCETNEEMVIAPELSTTTISEISGESAISGGIITSNGGAEITARGVCWSTQENPTIADFKTSNEQGIGQFISILTNLEENTTYHVRAYATNSAGTSYGENLTFITLKKPIITTEPITELTMSSAISGGNITSDGGEEVTSRGVCWSTQENPTIEDFKTSNGSGIGEFISNVNGLTELTTYHLRAYATNLAGTSYGENLMFKTLGKPTVRTLDFTDLATTSVITGGIIESDGGSSITGKGVCWSTSPSPTVDDDKTEDGAGLDDFISTIEDLARNTTYFIRAYAINDQGISYGEEFEITTYEVMDIDGNGYYSVSIGSQVWLTTNLKVTKYRNGDEIANVTDANEWSNLTTGGYCDYNNEASNSETYGRLYNWYAVEDSRSIAPEGWHVATKAEWDELVNNLGGEGVSGGKLKETGTTHWQSPNTGATNETGFTALPGGGRGFESTFSNQGIEVSWWTSTENLTPTAYGRYVVSSNATCPEYSTGKESGSYVRCIKD